MFSRKRRSPEPSDKKKPEKNLAPKYPKPKILLLDLKDNSQEQLVAHGYHVEIGSFGKPYEVEKSDSMVPVIPTSNLPTTLEHELVVIDLTIDEIHPGPVGKKVVSDGENDWWTSSSEGVVDPRPRVMASTRATFDRILAHGGIFVIFTSPRIECNFHWAHLVPFRGIDSEGKLNYDNWSLLSLLSNDHVSVVPDSGKEIESVKSNALSDLIRKHGDKSYFTCILSRKYGIDEANWFVLARSKYGDTVSVLIGVDNRNGRSPGWVILVHQLQNKAPFLLDLLSELLPDLAPHLCPYAEKNMWIRRPEYELPDVLRLQSQIETIRRDATRQIEQVETEIDEFRKKKRYLYDLLSETDDALVQAVIEGLHTLGFTEVVDVDQLIKESNEGASLREDIQIKDSSPVLIVDVKGITGRPSDAEATQAHRHAVMRMKEWKTTEVNALSIINHERHLPPLDRDNDMPFRQEILDGASQMDLGLMTTWDFHRLIRSAIRNEWKPENVKPLFYRRGRIGAVPLHYQYLGDVKQMWKKAGAASIQFQEGGLKKGDRIAFEMPVEFAEQIVESMQLNDHDVAEAPGGVEVGIATPHVESLRVGMRVYLVRG